jgi:hypothetical protein
MEKIKLIESLEINPFSVLFNGRKSTTTKTKSQILFSSPRNPNNGTIMPQR